MGETIISEILDADPYFANCDSNGGVSYHYRSAFHKFLILHLGTILLKVQISYYQQLILLIIYGMRTRHIRLILVVTLTAAL
jgi:hypothetical protein